MADYIRVDGVELNVGDIVTAYQKGYWKITSIERRYLTETDLKYECYKNNQVGDEYSALVYLELIADSNGTQPKKKARIESCDASYCSVFTKDRLEKMKQDAIAHFDKLYILLGGKP